jgi:hypothetical protein
MKPSVRAVALAFLVLGLAVSAVPGAVAPPPPKGSPNRPPAFTSVPVITANAGQQYTYQAQAEDPDNDPLTYSLPVKPEGMQVDPQSGRVTWTPPAAGTYSVTLRVADPYGGAEEQSWTITVP